MAGLLRLLMKVAMLATLAQAAGAVDPAISWRTLRTTHFEIVYDSKHYELAKMYARFAEQSWATLSPVFKEYPEKTVVVLDDSTDLANGLAMGIPFPTITAYPVMPTGLESIGDFGNWGLELLLHEYTHILAFEPAHGFYRPLRWVFGSVIRPNALLPRWYHEGLAVETETRFSTHGRLRSPSYLAIPRAMIEEGVLMPEDIARINESTIPDWPGGMRPYLMGALLWNEIAQRGGDGVFHQLSQSYSTRLPYLIDGPVKSLLGVDYQGLLSQTYAKLENNARQQITKIAAAGEQKLVALQQEGIFSHSPTISPDGNHLVFVTHLENGDAHLNLISRTGGENRPFHELNRRNLATGKSVQRVSWFPDSRRFIYDSVESFKRHYRYSDLFIYDLDKGQARRLTRGLRALEATVSPDGSRIVFRQNTPGGSRLAAMASDGSGLEVLYEPSLQVRVSRPEFLKNGDLIFSEKAEGKSERLRVFSFAKKSFRDVLPQFRPAAFPRQTAQGLLFVSARSGVENAYLADDQLTSARALTNTTTRILNADLDQRTGELYLSRLSARGPALYAASASEWQNRQLNPPRIGTLLRYRWPKLPRPQLAVPTRVAVISEGAGDDVLDDGDTSLDSHAIQPVGQGTQENSSANGDSPAAPRVSAQTSTGSSAAGGTTAQTSGALDPSSTSELTIEDKPYRASRYLLPRYWIPYVYLIEDGGVLLQAMTTGSDPLGKHIYNLQAMYDSLSQKTSWGADYTNNSTEAAITLAGSDYYEYLGSSGFVRRNTSASLIASLPLPGLSDNWQFGGGARYAQTGILGTYRVRSGPSVFINYSNISKGGKEISPESGGTANLSYTNYLPELGHLSYDETRFRGSTFLSGWLPEHHALAMFFNASVAPRLKSTLLGTTTVGGNYQASLLQSDALMRGYPSGNFFGRNLLNATLEYRFPLMHVYRGFGTWPLFINRLHGALFVDATTLDGIYYDQYFKIHRTSTGKAFFGTGVEARADLTIAYHLPLTLVLGLYSGLDQNAGGALTPFIGLSL